MHKEKRVTDLENHVFETGPKWPQMLFMQDGKYYQDTNGKALTPEEVEEWRNEGTKAQPVVALDIGSA